MTKELKAFRKICKNLNSYEFTDEYEKNKKLIEKALDRKEKSEKVMKELGIDLDLLPTLLKIKQGDKIYVIDGTLVEAEVTGNSLIDGKLMVFSHYVYNGITYTPVCYYSEYGKTWALTKEELEK